MTVQDCYLTTKWPDSTREVEWVDFKKKFTEEYLPKEAVRKLAKEMDELAPTGMSIAEFNDKYRELKNRQGLITDLLTGEQGSEETAEQSIARAAPMSITPKSLSGIARKIA